MNLGGNGNEYECKLEFNRVLDSSPLTFNVLFCGKHGTTLKTIPIHRLDKVANHEIRYLIYRASVKIDKAIFKISMWKFRQKRSLKRMMEGRKI